MRSRTGYRVPVIRVKVRAVPKRTIYQPPHAGDDVGSCVIVTIPPAAVLANCTAVFRVPGGNITAQFPAIQGPTPKAIAVSGGTGNYRNIGGDGTLVEFGNGKGKLTLHVLSNIEEAD
jgi:hypothetical protein